MSDTITKRVSLRKDSAGQRFAAACAELGNKGREDNLRTDYGLFKLMGGGTIDYRKPGSDRPAPGVIASALGEFVRVNNA